MSNFTIKTIVHYPPGELRELYENSFILHERRMWDQQMELLNTSRLKLSVIENEHEFTGFVFYWLLNGFIFVEHFAIQQEWRGKGAGTFIMNWLIEKFTAAVLEVEPPQTSVNAARRIQFYVRLGFRQYDAPYMQPAYHPGNAYTPMRLMHINMDIGKHSFEDVRTEIYKTVYGVNPGL